MFSPYKVMLWLYKVMFSPYKVMFWPHKVYCVVRIKWTRYKWKPIKSGCFIINHTIWPWHTHDAVEERLYLIHFCSIDHYSSIKTAQFWKRIVKNGEKRKIWITKIGWIGRIIKKSGVIFVQPTVMYYILNNLIPSSKTLNSMNF